MSQLNNNFLTVYEKLFQSFGPQHWWPGDTQTEIIVGAVLTQNTNWGNVEKALGNLRKQNLLDVAKIHKISQERLARLIKPAGYFNVKARRLKNLIKFIIGRYQGDLKLMARTPLGDLRKELLGVNGVGPETADSILLYAFNKPVFVVDAYTKRFLYRHNLIDPQDSYHTVQELFTANLKSDRKFFNEYHALIVRLGKDFCKPTPRCEQCPLKDFHYSIERRCAHCFRHLPLAQICSHCDTNV